MNTNQGVVKPSKILAVLIGIEEGELKIKEIKKYRFKRLLKKINQKVYH